MSIPRNLIYLLLFCVYCWSCNTRYGYRNKVSVAHKIHPQSKTNERKINGHKALQPAITIITASVQESIIDLPKTILLFPPAHNDSIKADVDKKIVFLKKVRKTLPLRHYRKPVNFYARWALQLGFIALLTFPFIIPVFIGPTVFVVSIKAIKQLRFRDEKGRGRAAFGIIVGTATSIILVYAIILLITTGSFAMGFVALFIGLFVNYALIRNFNSIKFDDPSRILNGSGVERANIEEELSQRVRQSQFYRLQKLTIISLVLSLSVIFSSLFGLMAIAVGLIALDHLPPVQSQALYIITIIAGILAVVFLILVTWLGYFFIGPAFLLVPLLAILCMIVGIIIAKKIIG